MKRWISIAAAAAIFLAAGFGWRGWLPAATEFTLRQQSGISLRRLGIALLRNTDPIMRNIEQYLLPEFTEDFEEHFLYFQKEEPQEEAEEDAIKAANLSALSGTYRQINGTALANATSFDVSDLLDQKASLPQFEKNGPEILIYHTHTTECYRNSKGRINTEDKSQNVVAVGAAMAEVFRAAGYETIHLTDIYNRNFGQAYATSRAAVEKALKKYPSIKVVLDIHRDSISSNGVDYYPVTEVEGRKAAQVMIVCGTDAKGLSHPEWRQNFVYGLALSRKMGALYGEISRPVNLRKDRFNTHFTPHTLLLEVGSDANTLEQAIYGGELSARAMIALWNNT